jgi:hypothetical protein
MGKQQVPNTISDGQAADLSRRARRANPESMFSREAVARRQADDAQRQKADQS